MRQEMGPENIFIFGMTVQEVEELGKRGYGGKCVMGFLFVLCVCVCVCMMI